jgi:hypothetical protein
MQFRPPLRRITASGASKARVRVFITAVPITKAVRVGGVG